MKTLKRSITVLVCLILFTSCTKSIDGDIEKEYIERRNKRNYLITYYKGEPFTGEIFRNYDNGQLKAKINYTDGKYDGLSEGYYKNGKKDGVFITRGSDGKTIDTIVYKDDIPVE